MYKVQCQQSYGWEKKFWHTYTPCRNFSRFFRFKINNYNVGLWENIFSEAYTNDPYIWHKNNITQFYFILGRAKLRWNFSSWLRDASDIHRFPTVHMVKTHFLLENLWISKPSLGILERFQRSSALPNIKYNCAILFLCEMYGPFVYASKYIVS